MDVSARIVTLELAETFVISREASDTADVLVVELRHSGVSGFGEAAPIERYEESVESAQRYVEENAELLGDDPFALEEVMERLPARELAARAAVEAALHDLQGKLLGQPVWRLLGLQRAGPPTSWTVWLGDPDDMACRAEKPSRECTGNTFLCEDVLLDSGVSDLADYAYAGADAELQVDLFVDHV